ncbi:uncharacterized protein LOC134235629 [Saccostrea cucullata]|uniref:uncharacterized protein LOC134235629 n=1 Tax=Saccostrea cuccullata TaxID=36930 RepID=UPI002ED10838
MQRTQQMQYLSIKKLEERLNKQEALTSTQANISKINQRKLEHLENTVAEQKKLILELSEKNNLKNDADIHNLIHSTNSTGENKNRKDLTKSFISGSQKAFIEGVISRPERVVAADNGVAFYAYLPRKELHPAPGHTLIFRSVVTNAGFHYNQHNGMFTSPGNGVYVFTWTISVWDFLGTELVVNSYPVGATYTTGKDVLDIRTTTGVVVVMLNRNDVVYVRVNADSRVSHKGDIWSDFYYKTSFCGWKLF